MKNTKIINPEIRKALLAIKPKLSPEISGRYHGSVNHEDREPDEQSRLLFYGLMVPQVRDLGKHKWSFRESAEKEFKIWEKVFLQSQIGRASCRERVCQYV